MDDRGQEEETDKLLHAVLARTHTHTYTHNYPCAVLSSKVEC